MALEGTSPHTMSDRPAPVGGRRVALVRAMYLVLWLLAVSVLAQAIFAGLFLDGHDTWRDWHAVNGMVLLPLLALVQVVLAVLVWRPGRGPGWPASSQSMSHSAWPSLAWSARCWAAPAT